MSVLSQSTIAKKVSFSGIGIHTGRTVNIDILPSSPNSGIVFKAGKGVGTVTKAGLPIGIGQPWFEGIEPSLAKGLSAIPAVRAVEFGHGVNASKMRGSAHNTAWHSSDNGPQHGTDGDGALGGISTGSPLRIRVHLKPPSSIPQAQDTLHVPSGEQRPLVVGGRHDPVLAPRAAPVVEAVTAFLLTEALLSRTRPF